MSSRKTPSGPSQSLFDFGPVIVERETRVEIIESRIEVRETTEAPVVSPERSAPKTFTVAELVRGAARSLEARYSAVWVEGEVSNLSTPRSGHVYFTLKDSEAQLPSVMFRAQAQRLGFELQDGLKVRARGRLSIFEGQGKFQLYVESLEPAGLGALQLAFEQLKKKLAAEGLFETSRKRALPKWPKRIGIATSVTGAAVRDMLRIAGRRGRVRVVVAGCQVQGDGAAFEIIAAIRWLEAQPDVDVIIVGRGGGSAEDLAAFNDEALARVIAACRVPVVSAVGHEVDFTIADFVADLRAATPSAAAELVVPLFADAEDRLAEMHTRLVSAGRRVIAEARQRLDGQLERAQSIVLRRIAERRRLLDDHARRLASLHPRARLGRDRAALGALKSRLDAQLGPRLSRDRAQLVALGARLDTRIRQLLDARRRAFGTAAGKLDALSPLGVLSRGYALVRDGGGTVVSDAADVNPGDSVTVTLARGELDCRVQSTKPAAAPVSASEDPE